MPFNSHLRAIHKELRTGIARQHAYRPALKALLEALDPSIVAVNDPGRIECRAPDFIITRNAIPQQACVEAKDVDTDLGKVTNARIGAASRILGLTPGDGHHPGPDRLPPRPEVFCGRNPNDGVKRLGGRGTRTPAWNTCRKAGVSPSYGGRAA